MPRLYIRIAIERRATRLRDINLQRTSMPPQASTAPEVSLQEFQEARKVVSSFAYHTPLLTSRILSERTGFDVRLKAEMFQKGGSYKLRGPLNKFSHLSEEQKKRGVICSSAGNHAQGGAR